MNLVGEVIPEVAESLLVGEGHSALKMGRPSVWRLFIPPDEPCVLTLELVFEFGLFRFTVVVEGEAPLEGISISN